MKGVMYTKRKGLSLATLCVNCVGQIPSTTAKHSFCKPLPHNFLSHGRHQKK